MLRVVTSDIEEFLRRIGMGPSMQLYVGPRLHLKLTYSFSTCARYGHYSKTTTCVMFMRGPVFSPGFCDWGRDILNITNHARSRRIFIGTFLFHLTTLI